MRAGHQWPLSEAEERLALQIKALLPAVTMTREVRFHPVRKWRLDFLLRSEQRQVAVEVEGGIWTGGRHTRGKGFEADIEKQNEAVAMGFPYLRVTPRQIKSGQAIRWIERALK